MQAVERVVRRCEFMAPSVPAQHLRTSAVGGSSSCRSPSYSLQRVALLEPVAGAVRPSATFRAKCFRLRARPSRPHNNNAYAGVIAHARATAWVGDDGR
jgi:hypothetical protein